MRVDPVPQIYTDLPAPAAKDNNPLIAAEVELQANSENIPVPAAAIVQTGTQGSRPDTASSKGQIAWKDDPPHQVYQVVDREGDVVIQIPSEQVLQVAKQIDSTLKQEDKPRGLDVRS